MVYKRTNLAGVCTVIPFQMVGARILALLAFVTVTLSSLDGPRVAVPEPDGLLFVDTAGLGIGEMPSFHDNGPICTPGFTICTSEHGCCGSRECSESVDCPEGSVEGGSSLRCCPKEETCESSISGYAYSGKMDMYCGPFENNRCDDNRLPTQDARDVLITIVRRQSTLTMAPPPTTPVTLPSAAPSTPPVDPPTQPPSTNPSSPPSTPPSTSPSVLPSPLPSTNPSSPSSSSPITPSPSSITGLPTTPVTTSSNGTAPVQTISSNSTVSASLSSNETLSATVTPGNTTTSLPGTISSVGGSTSSGATALSPPLPTGTATNPEGPSTSPETTELSSPASHVGPSATGVSSPVPTNATVTANSPNITYSGNWTAVQPVCNTSTSAMQCTGADQSFSYAFKGTAVYLNLGISPDGGLYSVDVDGDQQQLDSYSTDGSECKLGFTKEGLENKEHNMTVKTLGPSPQAPVGSEGGLDIESIIVTTENTPPQSSSSSGSVVLHAHVVAAVYGLVVWFIM